MYLLDTEVLSEARKGEGANAGVQAFFIGAAADEAPLYLSVITIHEMREGAQSIRHRGDEAEANRQERWLERITAEYAGAILGFDERVAHLSARLQVAHPENSRDTQMAATALAHDLTLVTRNCGRYELMGVRLLNPFF